MSSRRLRYSQEKLLEPSHVMHFASIGSILGEKYEKNTDRIFQDIFSKSKLDFWWMWQFLLTVGGSNWTDSGGFNDLPTLVSKLSDHPIGSLTPKSIKILERARILHHGIGVLGCCQVSPTREWVKKDIFFTKQSGEKQEIKNVLSVERSIGLHGPPY